jgi:hypothetical protein
VTKILALLLALTASAGAASLPPDGTAEPSPRDVYAADQGEVRLPRGTWCLVYSVHNDPGEPRTLVFWRGKFGWCDPADRFTRGRAR